MKIAIIQEAGRHEKNKNFRECLSMQRALGLLGHDSHVWGLGHDNYGSLPDWENYDAILNLENYDSTDWLPDLSNVFRPKKILWSIDAHVRGMRIYKEIYNRGNYDIILQATKDFVDDDSVWFPNCYDSTLIDCNPAIKKENFLGFCGSLLNRAEILNFLTEQFSIKKDIWVLGEDMVHAVNSYKVHFNLNLSNDINYRSFETIGCGTALMTNSNKQYDELGFVDGMNSIFYSSVEEIVQKLSYYKKNEKELLEIQKNSITLAEKHTYNERATRLVEIINEL